MRHPPTAPAIPLEHAPRDSAIIGGRQVPPTGARPSTTPAIPLD
jgi:hypothetical protein